MPKSNTIGEMNMENTLQMRIEKTKVGKLQKSKYALVSNVNGKDYIINIPNHTTRIIVYTTLIYKKNGKPVSRNMFTRKYDEKSEDSRSLKKIYDTIFRGESACSFKEWCEMIRDNNHRLSTGKSQYAYCLRKAEPSLAELCKLDTSVKRNVVFYDFNIDSDNIIIPDELELSIAC